jgi:hypothetical protein
MRLVAVLVIAAAACHHGPDQAQLEHDATAAMAESTRVFTEETPKLQDAIAELSGDIAVGSDLTLGHLHDHLLASLDRVLAADDRAMATSDAYVATGVELSAHTTALLKQMHGRNDTMHHLRDRLAAIKPPLTEAATDEITKALMNAGTMLLLQ